ncbi:hypothetical protein CRE_03550 [Caenorhabditis remanei]|uniref:Uncharacterized protein n=1 Tax=Caenorhabditis remanei TaxID=31234 RepID=E3NQA1_CAERE|nr:hypothetical protein CRE_03550 [Caenorhabditis remanei]
MLIKVLLCLIVLLNAVTGLSRHPKLLLISFDGFRYDLLEEGLVPNIHKWATMSTWFTSGVKSQYVTYTAPNHMSIATGMFEEEHGIVGNYFFDAETKKMFDYFNSTGKDGAVNASPSRFLVQIRFYLEGLLSFYWPDGRITIPRTFLHRPKIANFADPGLSVGDLKNLDAKMLMTLSMFFTREKRATFSSDHKHVMCVKNFVSGAGFEMGDHMIYPHSEEIGKQIYTNLTEAVKKYGYEVNIHWKEDVPERWHYKNSSRIGKIVFEPQVGSAISFSCTSEQMEK